MHCKMSVFILALIVIVMSTVQIVSSTLITSRNGMVSRYSFQLGAAATTTTPQSSKAALLEALSGLNYGVKATKEDQANIEKLVQLLKPSRENLAPTIQPASAFAPSNSFNNRRQRALLGGNWQLQYTSGPDVTSIGKIPGVSLDYVGQIVDIDRNVITNLVSASGFLADTNQEVYVNAKQSGSSRVELDFFATKIQLVKVFGQETIFGKPVSEIKPFEIAFDKEQFAKQLEKSGRPTPAFDIEYIDQDLRIQRTGEGYLFIIKKLPDEGTTGASTGERDISLFEEGLGPWLTQKVGPNAMKALGLVSIVPYILFITRGAIEISTMMPATATMAGPGPYRFLRPVTPVPSLPAPVTATTGRWLAGGRQGPAVSTGSRQRLRTGTA